MLRARGESRREATTIVEVVQAFAHVRARRWSRAGAVALARHEANAFALLVSQPEDLHLGLALFARYSALGAFDAVLAAVALHRGVEALVSADRAFGLVPGRPWIDHATTALDRLLDF